LLDVHRPVQIIFAGKAHPADDPGKSLIQHIYNLAKHNQFGGRIAFIEDYDMHIARRLKQGSISGSTIHAGRVRPAAPAV
jgi:glycogen phosphorylase